MKYVQISDSDAFQRVIRKNKLILLDYLKSIHSSGKKNLIQPKENDCYIHHWKQNDYWF